MVRKKLSRKEIRRLEEEAGLEPSSAVGGLLGEGLEWCVYLFLLFIFIKFTQPIWEPVYNFISGLLS